MAQLTAANAAAYGHQGAHGNMAFYAAGRPEPIALRHCFMMSRQRGYPSEYFSKIGAKHTAAAESEGAAAATPSALNTPTGVTLTPAGFLLSLAINSQAFTRSLAENDPGQIANDEIGYACGAYLMDDATVGLGALFDTVTATDGDTGTALTLDGILDAPATVRSNLDIGRAGVSTIIDAKGVEDVTRDIITNGASYFGNPAVEKFVKSFLDTSGMDMDEDDGFWMSPDARSAVFVEDGYSMLIQQGGDRVGCSLISVTDAITGRIPRLPSQQTGERRIAPAFAICVDEDPIAGARDSMHNVRDIDTPSGPVAVSTDANVGVNYITFRGRGNSTVALVNDNSACECRYLA